jgi:hypothetical protein
VSTGSPNETTPSPSLRSTRSPTGGDAAVEVVVDVVAGDVAAVVVDVVAGDVASVEVVGAAGCSASSVVATVAVTVVVADSCCGAEPSAQAATADSIISATTVNEFDFRSTK